MIFKSKYLSRILLPILALAFCACDDGRIYEEEYQPDTSGKVMKLTARISGLESWPRGYSVVLAGFEEGNEYAVITKPVPFTKDQNEQIELVMSGIPTNVTKLQLCTVNRQRVLVHSYVEMDCRKDEKDTIRMENVVADVNMYNAIQNEIFSDEEYGCVKCHGERESLAGGVNLLKGHSYASLVNRHSGVAGGDTLIVQPGNADASTLHLMLGTDFGKKCKYNHSNILINSYKDMALVKDWINNGAKE